MTFLPLHQNDLNPTLFGLLEGRLLAKGRTGGPSGSGGGSGEAGSEHYVPEDEVARTEREAKESKETAAEDLLYIVENYNDHWGSGVEEKDQKKDEYYQSLTIDFDDLPGLINRCKSIQRQIALKVEGSPAALEKHPQYLQLTEIIVIVDNVMKLPAHGREAVLQAHRNRLSGRHERMIQAQKRIELWSKQPAYKKINSVFDSVKGNKEFDEVWGVPDGLPSAHQREARELFLAILAEKTNGFKTTFVLGDEQEFGNDFEENIRRHPFIYQQFLEYEGSKITGEAVSPEAINRAASKASEATRKLDSIDDADVIVRNNSAAGISPDQLPARPPVPDTENWIIRRAVLESMRRRLIDSANTTDDPELRAGWQEAAADLRIHEEEAEAYIQLSSVKDREQTVKSRFTRKFLSDEKYERLVMGWAMKKYMKAMQVIDNPNGNASWKYTLHPTVRRLLIATAYENGVATYEADEQGVLRYDENLKDNHTWMLSNLALSEYFSHLEKGAKMDDAHNDVLKAAYLGGRIANLIRQVDEVEGLLELIRTGAPESDYEVYPPRYVKMYQKYSPADAIKTLAVLRQDRERLQQFLNRAQVAIRNPYSPESKAFMDKIRNNEYRAEVGSEVNRLGKIGIIDGATLGAYEKQMEFLQINFDTAEMQEQNMLQYFEGMGMKIEAIYPFYLEAIKNDPSVKTEYWHKLLLGSDAEFKKLIDLMKLIISENDAGGKQDFLAGLVLLHRKFSGKKELPTATFAEGSQDAATINVLQMLKMHLSARGETGALSDRMAKEADARRRGMNVGDHITKYVGAVWDMMAGPGQSISNRAAGFILMYGLYKTARSAMKGDTPFGKMSRALFVATALEIGVKNVTGQGILDRFTVNNLGSMEGDYEAVLVFDAEEDMKKKEITQDAHREALMSLNGVPFHKVMAWYESSDPNGMPEKDASGKPGKDLLPPALKNRLGTIAKHMGKNITEDDKELIGRRVLYESVSHFFGYVGRKENNSGAKAAKESLKERWIKMVADPDYKPSVSDYSHREFIQTTHPQPNDITWAMVMRSEISTEEAKATVGKSNVGQLEAGIKDGYRLGMEWLYEHVYNPNMGNAEKLLESMGQHAQKTKEFLEDAYEWSGQKLYFGKESIVLWYKEHQYEIKRVGTDHWQLLVTSVKLPFQIIYGVDKLAIPFTLTQLKAAEQILESSKTETINHDITPAEVCRDPQYLGSSNTEKNPQFTFYGRDQRHFMRAVTSRDHFYEYVGASEYESHIGYYVSEVSAEEAGINWDNPFYSNNPDHAWSKMMTVSQEKARKRFLDTGKLSPELVNKYMFAIHTIKKSTDPKKMYVFWRMPLRGSIELDLLASGRLPDYTDPNRRKHRETFTIDPSQSGWENMQRAFLLHVGPARTIVSGLGKYAAQLPSFFYWNIEAAGSIVKGAGHLVIYGNKDGKSEKQREDEFDETIEKISVRDDAHKQMIDEMFTSGMSENLALSEFYSNPVNAKLYKFSYDYAIESGNPLFLGLMDGREGYKGKLYLDSPNKRKAYEGMVQYYNDFYVSAGKRDTDIEAAIKAQVDKL